MQHLFLVTTRYHKVISLIKHMTWVFKIYVQLVWNGEETLQLFSLVSNHYKSQNKIQRNAKITRVILQTELRKFIPFTRIVRDDIKNILAFYI